MGENYGPFPWALIVVWLTIFAVTVAVPAALVWLMWSPS
jgi:hypothetical protein